MRNVAFVPVLVTALVLSAAAPWSPATAETSPAASWDFNGDGLRDIATADPGEEEGGPGHVTVRLRSTTGYGAPLVLQHPEAAEGNDQFGDSLASADVDRDGFADLVVGASTAYSSRETFGSVTVFHGSADGISAADASTIGWPRRADSDLLMFGSSVVIADFTSDGWPDLAVGAVDGLVDNGGDRSFVAILRGGPQGFSQRAAYKIPAPSGSVWFGSVLASGDVNRDGHPDLVESGGSNSDAPHLTYVPGTAGGPRRARVISASWGASIAIGNVTGDRYPDVVVSRPYGHYDYQRRHPIVGKGRVTLFRGSASGPRAGVTVTQESPGVPGRSQARDMFGTSVTILDVNANGRREVVVSAPGDDVKGLRDAGRLVVLRVGKRGFRTTGNRALSQATDGVPGELRKRGNFGTSVSALDWTGDRHPDLLVGSQARYDQPGLLTVLDVVRGPLGTGGGTVDAVLDSWPLVPRDSSSD